MQHTPVRMFSAILAVMSLALFTGVLGWGHAARSAPARMQGSAKPRVQANTKSPAPAERPFTSPTQPEAAAKTNGSATKAAVAPQGATHVVEPGDTLLQIAGLYGVTVSSIRSANQLPADQIRAGQSLVIPGASPLRRHDIKAGDTLWELASQYGVTIEELLQANRSVNPGHLQVGEELRIPAKSAAVRAASPAVKDEEISLGGLFTWPLLAPISSNFGPRDGRNHAGIDLAANSGEPIKAARDGKVLLSGTVPGYGYTVILQHADGTRTLYAHASALKATVGQSVKQGDVIALVGSTGRSTGPHLHFEIIVNDVPRDPLRYLPPR